VVGFATALRVEGPLALVCTVAFLPILETSLRGVRHTVTELTGGPIPTLHENMRLQAIVGS
jgi:hypothetical protein